MEQMSIRESCLKCALKHVAQARVLMLEYSKGYDRHMVFAMGHLAEAEDELLQDHPDMAILVREHRVRLEYDWSYKIPFGELIDELLAYERAEGAYELGVRDV